MGNSYSGVSDKKLRKSQIDVAKCGYMREDQVQFRDQDMNPWLQEVQAEYDLYFDKQMAKLDQEELNNDIYSEQSEMFILKEVPELTTDRERLIKYQSK